MAWRHRNVWLQLRCPPPPYVNLHPKGSRFKIGRLLPYEGYMDRRTGNYVMNHNKPARWAPANTGNTQQ